MNICLDSGPHICFWFKSSHGKVSWSRIQQLELRWETMRSRGRIPLCSIKCASWWTDHQSSRGSLILDPVTCQYHEIAETDQENYVLSTNQVLGWRFRGSSPFTFSTMTLMIVRMIISFVVCECGSDENNDDHKTDDDDDQRLRHKKMNQPQPRSSIINPSLLITLCLTFIWVWIHRLRDHHHNHHLRFNPANLSDLLLSWSKETCEGRRRSLPKLLIGGEGYSSLELTFWREKSVTSMYARVT